MSTPLYVLFFEKKVFFVIRPVVTPIVTLIIVDYCSRFAWIFFPVHTSEPFHVFEMLYKRVYTKQGYYISSIRNDREAEFKNEEFQKFCKSNCIHHNFSSAWAP